MDYSYRRPAHRRARCAAKSRKVAAAALRWSASIVKSVIADMLAAVILRAAGIR